MTGSVGLVTVRAPAPRGPNALPATPRPRRSSPFPPPAACARGTRAGALLCAAARRCQPDREKVAARSIPGRCHPQRAAARRNGASTTKWALEPKVTMVFHLWTVLPGAQELSRREVTAQSPLVTDASQEPGRHDSTDDLGWDEHHQHLLLSGRSCRPSRCDGATPGEGGVRPGAAPDEEEPGGSPLIVRASRCPRHRARTRAVGPRLCPPKSLPGRSDACR